MQVSIKYNLERIIQWVGWKLRTVRVILIFIEGGNCPTIALIIQKVYAKYHLILVRPSCHQFCVKGKKKKELFTGVNVPLHITS